MSFSIRLLLVTLILLGLKQASASPVHVGAEDRYQDIQPYYQLGRNYEPWNEHWEEWCLKHDEAEVADEIQYYGLNDLRITGTIFDLADDYYRAERYDRAEQLYTKAISIEESPPKANTYCILSFLKNCMKVYGRRKDLANLKATCMLATNICKGHRQDPKLRSTMASTEAFYDLSHYLVLDGRFEEAKLVIEKNLTELKSDSNIEKNILYLYLFHLAESYRHAGKYSESVRWFEKALPLADTPNDMYFNFKHQFIELRMAQGEAYESLNQFHDAHKVYIEALKAESGNGAYPQYRHYYEAPLGNYKTLAFRKLTALKPKLQKLTGKSLDYSELYGIPDKLYLAVVLGRHGTFKATVELFSELIVESQTSDHKFTGDTMFIRKLYADCMQIQKRYDLAIQQREIRLAHFLENCASKYGKHLLLEELLKIEHCYILAGKPQECESLYRKIIMATEQRDGKHAPTLIPLLNMLGHCMKRSNPTFTNIQAPYLRVLSIANKNFSPDSKEVACAIASIGALYADTRWKKTSFFGLTKNHEDIALEHFIQAKEILNGKTGWAAERNMQSLQRKMAVLYRRLGKHKLADSIDPEILYGHLYNRRSKEKLRALREKMEQKAKTTVHPPH